MKALQEIRRGRRDENVFYELHEQWGNPFSLRPLALMHLFNLCLSSSGTYVDVGSGLSTLVMAAAAELTGASVIAADDCERWRNATYEALALHGCRNFAIVESLDDADFRSDFSEMTIGVLCVDGPQKLENRGAVYSELYEQLHNASVLADDTENPLIQVPFNQWVIRSGRISERFPNHAIVRRQ